MLRLPEMWRMSAASCGENASGEIDTRHLPARILPLSRAKETKRLQTW